MHSCLICAAPVESFISFGRMPIANGFLAPADFDREFFFELQTGFCERCHMVQLTELVDPSKLFHEHYAYFSSISVRMAQHFAAFAETVRARYLTVPDPFVVEVGSNDGIMLQHFAKAGVRHLGVEPSANVAAVARSKGIRTVSRFFNEEVGHDLRREYGAANAFLGANVICHLPDMHTMIRGVRALLADDGVFVFEEPYLGDIVTKSSYDQIYDEHVFYFALASLGPLFAQHGMEVIDVLPQATHGGSMRYVVARTGARPVQESVSLLREREAALKLTDPATYFGLRRRIEQSRTDLVALLHELKQAGKRVTGYGATSKSTTVTNYCGIGPELLEFVSDTTPGKQGLYSPGAHIPVVPYERFTERYPEFALLFAWNHGEEIVAKEGAFRSAGGRFISYVPDVHVMA
jgi:methylation protein EvaC